MDKPNSEHNSTQSPNKSKGPQGIDKAPGEETAQSTEQFISDTQKGKTKTDGDPSKESDRHIEQGESI